jgi:LPS O-antigen subunit length determinant protein (WzzB/FepE family)
MIMFSISFDPPSYIIGNAILVIIAGLIYAVIRLIQWSFRAIRKRREEKVTEELFLQFLRDLEDSGILQTGEDDDS